MLVGVGGGDCRWRRCLEELVKEWWSDLVKQWRQRWPQLELALRHWPLGRGQTPGGLGQLRCTVQVKVRWRLG